MAYSKLARTRPNFYKDSDYDENAYGGSNHRDGNFTHRRQIEIGNFSSHAKTFDLIPYDDYRGYDAGVNDTYDYCENNPYDYYKGNHDCYDYGDQSCGRGVNHEELVDEKYVGVGV
ncbi:hypothetical protein M9H77_16807 [Catharanthus roseus]|uniref:Uncharacterized protein n=1 Tax=Catharanthus roseus TaxID=4058 RepID=A0ACC0B2T5_CATRO|nr:hypothetical protein M9H77_16807 [Catharanthus roseus]